MDSAKKRYTVKVSRKGQMVIPAEIRRKLKIQDQTELQVWVTHDGQVRMEKKVSADDWEDLIRGIPVEEVVFKDDGTVDAKKSPHFAAWMNEDE